MDAPVHYCRLVINCARQLLAHLCSFFLSSVQSLTSSIEGMGIFMPIGKIFITFPIPIISQETGAANTQADYFSLKPQIQNFCLTAHSTLRIQQNITQHDSKILSRFEANLPYLKPNSYSRLSVDSIVNLSQV